MVDTLRVAASYEHSPKLRKTVEACAKSLEGVHAVRKQYLVPHSFTMMPCECAGQVELTAVLPCCCARIAVRPCYAQHFHAAGAVLAGNLQTVQGTCLSVLGQAGSWSIPGFRVTLVDTSLALCALASPDDGR